MTWTDAEAFRILRSAVDAQAARRRPVTITQAHRDEIVRHLQFGALSLRGLCMAIKGYDRDRVVDRSLVRRTLDSAIGRGEVIGVLVRRPGQSIRHRERAPYYVYAPAPHLLISREDGAPKQLHARRGVLG